MGVSFLKSRKTVLAGLVLALAAAVTAGSIPQSVSSTPATLAQWRSAHHLLAPWADRLGLCHVFSTWWFALILALSSSSLAASSLEQFRVAYRKSFPASGAVPADAVPVPLPVDQLGDVLRRFGYRRFPSREGLRLGRNLWGYWSGFLLHLGVLVVIGGALWVALTQQRGTVPLVEGETVTPALGWQVHEEGFIARPLPFPGTLRLDALSIKVKGAEGEQSPLSQVTLATERGTVQRAVAINDLRALDGVRVYQSNAYGDVFTVQLTSPDGSRHVERFFLPFPNGLDRPGYGDLPVSWTPELLSAKYYADAAKKSLTANDPLFYLRLLEGKRETARLCLKAGGEGALGPYQVKLLGVQRWSTIIFARVGGIWLVFTGFFILTLGSILLYFAPPRELLATGNGSGSLVCWRAERFRPFYLEEYAEIIKALNGEVKP